jgi:hypothetical protein
MGEEKEILLHGNVCAYLTGRLMGDPKVSTKSPKSRCVVVLNTEHYLSMETNLIRYFPDGAAKNTGVHYGAEIGRDPITNIYQLLAATPIG